MNTPFQWQVLGMLSVLAFNTAPGDFLQTLWLLSAILCLGSAIWEGRRRPK